MGNSFDVVAFEHVSNPMELRFDLRSQPTWSASFGQRQGSDEWQEEVTSVHMWRFRRTST